MKETKKVIHKLLTKMWKKKSHVLQMKILHGKKSSLKTIIENGCLKQIKKSIKWKQWNQWLQIMFSLFI